MNKEIEGRRILVPTQVQVFGYHVWLECTPKEQAHAVGMLHDYARDRCLVYSAEPKLKERW